MQRARQPSAPLAQPPFPDSPRPIPPRMYSRNVHRSGYRRLPLQHRQVLRVRRWRLHIRVVPPRSSSRRAHYIRPGPVGSAWRPDGRVDTGEHRAENGGADDPYLDGVDRGNGVYSGGGLLYPRGSQGGE